MGKLNSSQQIETKAEELRWFKSAQALCSAFPRGEPKQPDPPAPDIQFSGLGIEVTQYYKKQSGGSLRRRIEDKHDEILANAQRAFESVNHVKVFVSVSWTHDEIPINGIQQRLENGIVEIVRDLIAKGQQRWLPDWSKFGNELINQYLGDIWIHLSGQTENNWTSAESGMAGSDVARVQEVISGKEARVLGYRESCREGVWLLIVAEGRISSYFSPDEDFDGAIFRTNFDRVFVFDVFRNCVRKLAVQAL